VKPTRDHLLEAFREVHGPPQASLDRIHARLSTLGDPKAPRQRVRERPAPPWGRIAVAGSAIAIAALLGLWLRSSIAEPQLQVRTPPLASHEAERDTHGGTLAPREQVMDSTAVEESDPQPQTASTPTARPIPRPPRVPAPPEGSSPVPSSATAPTNAPSHDPTIPGPMGLARELALLQRARHELARGEPQAALATTSLYHERFPNGTLVEEANAVQAMASCHLEPAAGPSLLAKFTARYPKSLFRPRVAAACTNPREAGHPLP